MEPNKISSITIDETLPVSAPNSSNCHTLTPEIQDTVNKCSKRSNSLVVETKYKCTISSERLAQLRKAVEIAIRDHKVFSIKGGWAVIRRELVRRHWIEKYEPINTKTKNFSATSQAEDLISNLPAKQDWESNVAYVEKCEKTVMSRMLQNYDVDFYWSMKKEPSDIKHRANAYKLINRFSRSLFSSKEGLALLLQQSYWHTEPGIASVNFPRCYVLGFPDHYNLFVEDFRMTACIGLLKWFTLTYECKKKLEVSSPDGHVPVSALQFAMDRCENYVASQKHVDIDKDLPRIWDHEWDDFLTNYYNIVHHQGLFQEMKETVSVYANVKTTLKEIHKYWPEYEIDGMKNIWILKPGNKCRGRGIQLIKKIADVDKVIGQKLKYVVQKYIERPLIIYDTKFDIRQWFMVTSVQPLTIWIYRDSYLRFSSQIFSLNNFHESLHLTNHAVQCKYTNMQQRDKALPEDNMWDCHSFKAYLKQVGCMEKWDEVIFPGMKQNIICAMLASQDTMDRRPNTFEIYGADFMVSEDYRPWLLEINCSPDLSFSTTVTRRLCPQCMEDIIKVVIDKKRDVKVDTGLFEMIYKQNLPRIPPYLGMNLSVRGRKIFRNKTKPKPTEKEKLRESLNVRLKRHELAKSEYLKNATKILPKLFTTPTDLYKGPVIEDLIEELHKSYNTEDDSGVDFVPAVEKDIIKKKTERVAKKSAKAPKITKTNFVYRNQSTKENHKKSQRQVRSTNSNTKTSNTKTSNSNNNNFFGFFKEWALKNQIPCEYSNNRATKNDLWEKETVSILKGKNILLNKDVM